MLDLVFIILSRLVTILPWVLMAGWIISMADPSGRWAVTRILNTVTMPFIRRVSGMLPRIGQLDISPMVIVILSIIVNWLLWTNYANFR